jgi:hypothetical protein
MDAPQVTWLKSLGVWLLISILLTPSNLVGFTIHDEGFIATGAMLLLDGRLPYRDFLSFYGPAQYYLAAFLFALFGEDLLVLRLLHVAWLAALGTMVWAVGRKVAAQSSFLPLLGTGAFVALALYAMPSAGYPAIPATAFLIAAVFVLFGWTPAHGSRRLLAASALVGLAGLFRWDFGLYALIALSGAIIITLWSQKARFQEHARSVVGLVTPAVAIVAAVYVPLLLATDPWRWYHEIVEYSIYEFPKWRGTQMLGPSYRRWLTAIELGQLRTALYPLSQMFYVLAPAGLSIAVLVTLLYRLRASKRRLMGVAAALLFLSLLTLLLLQQMRVRPSLWQGFPAIATAIPMAVYLLVHLTAALGNRHVVTWGAYAATAIALLAAAAAGSPNLRAAFDSRLVALNCDRAHLIHVWPTQAVYADVIRYIRDQTSEDDRIYSGVSDHSKLHSNDSLLYFLTRRLPADRFVELDPGIANTPSGQQEIKDALDSLSVPMVVRASLDYHEPNLTSSSNGVFVLDDFISVHYAETASIGSYTLLRRKPLSP